jgi:DNA-binding PadR family transcriptional regulator
MTDLTATGRVILGMLSLGLSTGYEIKQLADRSTRHFWTISYGQIYPELRRLEEQGLVVSREDPTGGRRRTSYALTDAGREALTAWLARGDGLMFEQRCESMLKLFFSDAAPELRVDQLRSFARALEGNLAALRELQPLAPEMPEGPRLTLEFGIAQMQFMVDWCRRMESRLAADAGRPAAREEATRV